MILLRGIVHFEKGVRLEEWLELRGILFTANMIKNAQKSNPS